ncbi:MAG: RluA family pseudouridine synthase [Planctomycetaceae bacterium]|jgi:RluA family pseudouridine synthase|nr:RluA family pseudouridine synthase [Planctomycetaceae bacterium]
MIGEKSWAACFLMIDDTIIPEFDILLEDGPLLAVNKPFGLLTQAPDGVDSLEFRVKDYLIRRENKPGRCYLGIPHRLDRPASGVILFAKHARAARRLSEQFERRTVEKTYWAAVAGPIAESTGTWTDYMKKLKGLPQAVLAPPIDPDAREAVLHFTGLGHFDWGTWLEIRLETGRMHQIRLQAGSRGFPLLGDAQYGSNVTFGPQFEDERLRGIALHARSVSFLHPMTHESLTITAPIPEPWHALGIS